MNFFDKDNQIKEFSLESSIVKEFSYDYGIYYLHTKITSNGGPFLLTDDFQESQESRFQKQNERLKQNILVFQSDGQEFAQINKDPEIVGLEFLCDERLLEVNKNGYYSIYNPYNKNYDETHIPKKIPLHQFFSNKKSSTQKYEIDFVVSNGESFVLITKTKQIFLIYDIDKEQPDRIKINLDSIKDINFDYFNQNSISYYKDKNNYYFFIACLKKGFLFYQINLNEQSDINKIKKYDFMCQNIENRILEIIPTQGKKNILLALLTGTKSSQSNSIYQFKDIYIVKKNYPEQFYRTNLNLTEEERNTFQGLFWIGNYALAIGFKKNLKIISKSLPDPFDFNLNIIIEPQKLIYCSESDGLRLICFSKDFAKGINLMIRAKPQEYENITGELYFTPGKLLYECHKCYIDKQSPKNKEIVDDPEQLKIAIKELKRTIEYEIDQDKQKQYLKILGFGKLFLDGDKQGPYKDIIHEFSKKLKVYNNLKKLTKRAITYEQFEKLLKYDLENFCKILVNCNLFQIAYYLCNTKKKFAQKYIKQIFIEYSKKLIESISNYTVDLESVKIQQQKCAENILKTYKKIKEQIPTFESKILIDIANIAQKNKKKKIAEELLKEDNPVLLKITSYLDIEEYDQAMDLALEAKDSNALYLLFYKLINNNQETNSNMYKKLLYSEKPQIRQHFYRYLEINQGDKNLFLQAIQDPQEYFIQNFNKDSPDKDFQQEINNKKNLILKCQELKKQTNQKKQNFDYAQKYLEHLQKLQETEMYKHLPQQSNQLDKLTAYDIAKPYFIIKEQQYLNEQLDFSKDKDIQQFQKELNISEKQMFLFQIKYLIENIKPENIKYVEDYVIKYKNRKLGVFQLQVLFNKQDYYDSFIRILKNLDFNTVFYQCEQRKMFTEAAQIALHHNKKLEFENYINFVTPQSLKEKLLAEYKKSKQFQNEFIILYLIIKQFLF